MPNYATATIVGHLSKEPETRVSQNGKEITTFSVATKSGYGDHVKTTWWSVVCFGKTGEIAARFLSKGNPVMLVGEPCLEEWTDKDNAKRHTLRLIANQVVLIGSKDEGDRQQEAPAKPAAKKATDDAPFDDEIPF